VKWSDPNPSPDWAGAPLEAYLDGELSSEEAALLERLLTEDEALQAELDLARSIQAALRGLPAAACPPHVAPAVIAETRATWRRQRVAQLAAWWAGLWQPAVAMSILVALVVLAALLGRPAPGPPPAAQAAELEQAMEDVKWTLAFLSEVGRQTGSAVRHDVLQPHVVLPVQEALSRLDESSQPRSKR
jgi:anti-sigma factor RsiW